MYKNPHEELFSKLSPKTVSVLHNMCKDRKKGVFVFFGGVKDTIALRDYKERLEKNNKVLVK